MSDGGPAFPTAQDPEYTGAFVGMSLRDYFAAQSLMIASAAAMIKANDLTPSQVKEIDIAEGAYRFADAMLAARNQ